MNPATTQKEITMPEVSAAGWRWYLLACVDCDPFTVESFRSPAEREQWAALHTEGTGHATWLVADSRAQMAELQRDALSTPTPVEGELRAEIARLRLELHRWMADTDADDDERDELRARIGAALALDTHEDWCPDRRDGECECLVRDYRAALSGPVPPTEGRNPVVPEPMMPCVTCGRIRCPRGVARCVECDRATQSDDTEGEAR